MEMGIHYDIPRETEPLRVPANRMIPIAEDDHVSVGVDENLPLFIAISQSETSMHYSALALVNVSGNNSINPGGSHSALGWWNNEDGQTEYLCVIACCQNPKAS